MKDSMFASREVPSPEETPLVEGHEVVVSQRVLTIAQILVEGKKTKYALVAGDQIIDCVEGFEALVQELLSAFDELTSEAERSEVELSAATF